MKTTVKMGFVAIAAAGLLLSCYFMPTQTLGKINFNLAAAKSISEGAGALTHVSLYALSGSSGKKSLFTFASGKTYAEFSYPGTVSLSGIPVGSWIVLVSIGNSTSGTFLPDYYGQSAPIDIAPGVDNPVTVTTSHAPYQYALTGDAVTGVLVMSGSADYASTSSAFYKSTANNSGDFNTVPMSGLPTNLTINSLSSGFVLPGPSPAVYVNTSAGIYPYDGTSWSILFASGNPQSMLLSVGIAPLGTGNIDVYYAREGGLGGVEFTTSQYKDTWVDLDLSKKFTKKPIYDVAAEGSKGYFATKFGAFQLDYTAVGTSATPDSVLKEAKFITPPDATAVLSLSVDPAGANIYIGSTSGGWQAPVASVTGEVGTLSAVPGIAEGDSIVKVAASGTYVAFLSRFNLYIYDTSTKKTAALPFYSGLPGVLSGMAWDNSTLYVAGSTGLVSVDATSSDLTFN